jgi:hypothetical protein
MPVSVSDDRLWREGQKALDEALASLNRERADCPSANATPRCVLVNASQYVTLFNYDLRQMLYDIKRGGDSWGGRLYARLLALTLYECTEDITALLGRPLREAVSELGGPAALDTLKGLHKRAAIFFDDNRPLLQAIRLQVIGHREQDAAIQVGQLEALDLKHIEYLGYEMLKWLNDFYAFTSALWRSGVRRPA